MQEMTNTLTREQWLNEYDYITIEKFLKKLYCDGRITAGELHKTLRIVCDIFSPVHAEIRV